MQNLSTESKFCCITCMNHDFPEFLIIVEAWLNQLRLFELLLVSMQKQYPESVHVLAEAESGAKVADDQFLCGEGKALSHTLFLFSRVFFCCMRKHVFRWVDAGP